MPPRCDQRVRGRREGTREDERLRTGRALGGRPDGGQLTSPISPERASRAASRVQPLGSHIGRDTGLACSVGWARGMTDTASNLEHASMEHKDGSGVAALVYTCGTAGDASVRCANRVRQMRPAVQSVRVDPSPTATHQVAVGGGLDCRRRACSGPTPSGVGSSLGHLTYL